MTEKTILVALGIFSIGFGIFLFSKPLTAFDIQRRFYEKINWKIEPVSVEKEIRNTKMMGVMLIAFAVIAMAWGLVIAP